MPVSAWIASHKVAFAMIVGFAALAVVLVIVLPIVLIHGGSSSEGTGQGSSGDAVAHFEPFEGWQPQMWCYAGNTTASCAASKPSTGSPTGWQNRVVSDDAVKDCPPHSVEGYPADISADTRSWLAGVDAGRFRCNGKPDITKYVQAYNDTASFVPDGSPSYFSNPTDYFGSTTPTAEYVTSKYPEDCPEGSNCFTVGEGWGAAGGGACETLPPAADCASTQPRFNWIIGACMGEDCGGKSLYDANDATTKRLKNIGSRARLNYIAGYNFDKASGTWKIAGDSSFNTDARHHPYDLMRAHGGLDPDSPDEIDQPWLVPQSTEAIFWSNGYYPNGAEGLGVLATEKSTPGLSRHGSGAFMVVASFEECYNLALFFLNQNALNRVNGSTGSNCWSGAADGSNSGEIEFLENTFSQNNAGAQQDYRRMFANNLNQVGRSFTRIEAPDAGSVAGWQAGNWQSTAGSVGSSPFTLNSAEPVVYVFVQDLVGTWAYRIPSSELSDNTLWPGLGRTTAAAELQAAPARPPATDGGNVCLGPDLNYCLSFMPSCQYKDRTTAFEVGCSVNNWCGNWFSLFSNTRQWQWTRDGKWERPDEDGKVSDPLSLSTQAPGNCRDGPFPLPSDNPSWQKNPTDIWAAVCNNAAAPGCGQCKDQPYNVGMAPVRFSANDTTAPWGGNAGPSTQREIDYARACYNGTDYTTKCNAYF